MGNIIADNAFTPQALRHSFGAFPTGIVLIAATVDGAPAGMLANSFASISLDPPLVQLSFDNSSTTWPVLRHAPVAGISILSGANENDARKLRRSTEQRFEGIDLEAHEGGALTLPGAIATFLVEPFEDFAGGDHTIRLFRVLDHTRSEGVAPLSFYSGTLSVL